MPTAFRLVRAFHAWCGVALVLLVILSSLTGCLLVWKQDYVKLVTPGGRAAFEPSPQALATLATAVEMQYDSNDILLIEFATPDFPLTKVRLDGTRYAYLDTGGNVVDEWVQNERWEEWLYDLHHRLLLGDTDLAIVGFMALVLIVLVVAGLITFWPLRRGFRQGHCPCCSR